MPNSTVGCSSIKRRIGSVEEHPTVERSEEHTSELQSQSNLVCRLLLEKKKKKRLATTQRFASPHETRADSTRCSLTFTRTLAPEHFRSAGRFLHGTTLSGSHSA